MKNYKDFMEGYVVSADKKPAKDGRMLPARKIKTNDRPDDKEVDEKLDMKKADMGDVIKDFQDSDAPQFKGKSKEKRRQMAIAAKMQANEEVELDEEKVTHSDKSGPGKGKALKDMSTSQHIDSMEHHEREMMAADKKGQSYNVKHHKMMAKVHRVNAQGGSSMMHKEELNQEGVTGAVAGGVLGAAVGGGVGAAAGAYLGHKIQKAANKPKKEELSAKQKKIDKNKNGKIDGDDLKKLRGEEMTPDQKQKRLDMIRKAASSVAKKDAAAAAKARRDAKSGMKSDPVLGKRPVDEEMHVVKYHDKDGKHVNDSKPMSAEKAKAHAEKGNKIDKVGGKYTVHKIEEATPTRQQVKQGIGIARDKRYAGGNMTGAVKTMNKINKGLAQHPAVAKELQKQNEEKKYKSPTAAEIEADKKKDRAGKPRPSMTAKSVSNKQYAGMKGGLKEDTVEEAVGTAAKHAGKTGLMGGKYTSHDHMTTMKNFSKIRDQRAKQRDAEHKAQDPKHAAAGYAKHMVDTNKAKKKAAARGVDASHLNWKHTNGVKRGKLPEGVELHENEVADMYLRQLHFIDYAADELMEFIEMGGMCEEWVQNKLAKVHGDMETIHAWMEGTKRMNGMSQDDDDMDEDDLDSQESDVDYDESKPTFSDFMSRLNK